MFLRQNVCCFHKQDFRQARATRPLKQEVADMQIERVWWAGMALMFAMGGSAQAVDVNEPYAADLSFGINGTVRDTLVNLAPSAPPRASGQRMDLDEDGSTVVAGMATVSFFGDLNYLVVARYSASGQRLTWSNPTAGYTDDSHQYLLVQPITQPENLRIREVRAVRIGSYGDIHVLIDSQEPGNAARTDSILVTFGSDGAYKGIVTNMATANMDDTGAAIILFNDWMYLASSTDTQVIMSRYTLAPPNRIPVLDTSWAASGREVRVLPGCKHFFGGFGELPINCVLRAERGLISYNAPASIFVAGEFTNDQGLSGSEGDFFIMHFNPYDGTSDSHYPVKDGFTNTDDKVRGLAFRSKLRAPVRENDQLYVLDAHARPCGNGFSVFQFSSENGALDTRTFVKGGGSNADPNVCSQATSMQASDMMLAQDYVSADRYLAIVGTQSTSEPYTGTNGFLALADTEHMGWIVQAQEFTHTGGQFPEDAGFSALVGDFATRRYTVTGVTRNYDGDSSSAIVQRMRADRIFSNDFEVH